MKQSEIIQAIAALSNVLDANKGFVSGSENLQRMAQDKLKELIPQLDTTPEPKKCKHEKSTPYNQVADFCPECKSLVPG